MPDFSYENEAAKNGYKYICGVDEAGRGPLAGPVCAAAVILPEDCEIEGLNDSKKISEKKRELLYDIIIEKAVAYSIAYGTLEEIEQHNILEATYLAMNRAIDGLSVKTGLSRKTSQYRLSGLSSLYRLSSLSSLSILARLAELVKYSWPSRFSGLFSFTFSVLTFPL